MYFFLKNRNSQIFLLDSTNNNISPIKTFIKNLIKLANMENNPNLLTALILIQVIPLFILPLNIIPDNIFILIEAFIASLPVIYGFIYSYKKGFFHFKEKDKTKNST